jgi:hypothetical protein
MLEVLVVVQEIPYDRFRLPAAADTLAVFRNNPNILSVTKSHV